MTVPESQPNPRPAAAPSRPPRMAKPQPKATGSAQAAGEDAAGSGSATGFVGMLARRQFDADVLSATQEDQAMRRQHQEALRQAAEASPAAPPAAQAKVSLWRRLALPGAVVLGLVLVGIGGWAVGALIYMHGVVPANARDVHYPLLTWRAEAGGFTPASRFMARAMLLCLPAAILLVVIAWMARPRRK